MTQNCRGLGLYLGEDGDRDRTWLMIFNLSNSLFRQNLCDGDRDETLLCLGQNFCDGEVKCDLM